MGLIVVGLIVVGLLACVGVCVRRVGTPFVGLEFRVVGVCVRLKVGTAVAFLRVVGFVTVRVVGVFVRLNVGTAVTVRFCLVDGGAVVVALRALRRVGLNVGAVEF